MRSLPQVFSVPPLQTAQMYLLMQMWPRNAETGDGSISMCLWYLHCAGSRCSTRRTFPCNTVADDAIRLTVSSVRGFANMRGKSDLTALIFVFRVKGRSEYIYGSQPLINYCYIRDCVSKRAEIDLVVEPKEATLFAAPLFRPSYPYRTLANLFHADASKFSTSEICLWDLTSKLSLRMPAVSKSLPSPRRA